MTYNIYELHPRYLNNGVFKGKETPKLVYRLDTGDMQYYEFMQNNWYNDLVWREELQNILKLDTTYYAVAEDYSDFGVLTLYKGHTYFDGAEHDERVVIAVELGLTSDQAKILPRSH